MRASRQGPSGRPARLVRLRHALLRALLLLGALPSLYLVAALVGALVPRNASWVEPDQGVTIFVRTNGAHADLVLPARAAGLDWHKLLSPAQVSDPGTAQWVAIGWGQREFYLEAQSWSELRLGTALRALTGGDALMHVAHIDRPAPSARHRPLRLEPEAYRHMSASIARDFERDPQGRARWLAGEGYGADDGFYEARGVYHALRTSNQWTADMLARAGVTVGVWTPFAQGIMWRFRTSA